jgi:hypothetical protein
VNCDRVAVTSTALRLPMVHFQKMNFNAGLSNLRANRSYATTTDQRRATHRPT